IDDVPEVARKGVAGHREDEPGRPPPGPREPDPPENHGTTRAGEPLPPPAIEGTRGEPAGGREAPPVSRGVRPRHLDEGEERPRRAEPQGVPSDGAVHRPDRCRSEAVPRGDAADDPRPLEGRRIRLGGGRPPAGEGGGRSAKTRPSPRGRDPPAEPGDPQPRGTAFVSREAEGRGDGGGPGERRGRPRELPGAPGHVLLPGGGRADVGPDRGGAGPSGEGRRGPPSPDRAGVPAHGRGVRGWR